MRYAKNDHVYKMTKAALGKLMARMGKVLCNSSYCQKPIEVGDLVVSKEFGDGKRHVWHKKCYDELYIDL